MPRDLPVPGRELTGIHFAMEYLTQQNRALRGRRDRRTSVITATASTSSSSAAATPAPTASAPRIVRARAACTSSSCCQRPPDERAPRTIRGRRGRTSSASRRRTKKAASALYAVATERFTGDDGRVHDAARVRSSRARGRPEFDTVPGSEFELEADLVLLAMGFVGPERSGMLDELGVTLTERGNVVRDQQVDDERARRVRRRRHAARPVAHRLGHRRRPQLRPRRRRLSDGQLTLPAPVA